MRQTICVVHVFVPGQSPEQGLAKLPDQRVAAVLARPGVGESRSRQLRQPKCIIEFAKGEQTSVGRDPRTMKLQLQARIERDPESGSVFFTRCTVHLRP